MAPEARAAGDACRDGELEGVRGRGGCALVRPDDCVPHARVDLVSAAPPASESLSSFCAGRRAGQLERLTVKRRFNHTARSARRRYP